MVQKGSCHCGRIQFTVEGEPSKLMDCNCSICQRKGSLMWFVPYEQLHLKADPADLQSYTFNKHIISHLFCKHCGIHPFGEGTFNHQKTAAINVRCLEDFDFSALEITHYNGRDLK